MIDYDWQGYKLEDNLDVLAHSLKTETLLHNTSKVMGCVQPVLLSALIRLERKSRKQLERIVELEQKVLDSSRGK